MAGMRITNQSVGKQPPLILPHQVTGVAPGTVPMRIKTSQSSGDRLSQTKSMVLQDPDLPPRTISRHRRNQSQHNIGGAGAVETPVVLNGEYLNKAKISEGGKKLRKNWTSTWVVLDTDKLLFYKDSKQEALTNLKPGCSPDGMDLCGAVAEWTTEKSSRKNVLQITTSSGSEFLLQADNYHTISKWHDAIKRTADNLSKGAAGKASDKPGIRRANSTEYLPRHGLPSKTLSLPRPAPESLCTKEPKPEHRRSLKVFKSSKLTYSMSDSADKNGVKNRLKKFITRRPSMKTLQEKGIIKDRVFGCPLLALCEREGTTVPNFVRQCVEAVEKRGLEADGIYRVSGNLATIQKLRFLVDQEVEFNLDDSQWEDIHVVTGALKMFFRELPEPLFPFPFFELFVEAIKTKECKQKVQVMKKLVLQLPKPNQDTMRVLFRHLQTILTCSQKNLMSTQGISIVFGPTLMWPELDCGNMAVNMVYQNQIVEFILIESPEIFGLQKK
ncbi:rho GTPase-activating protein 15 isoform X1 [Salmo salar]|uniref:Rho GTPase-activating protein 15 n=1 Tax=Salmo salar TaxID=8030 RepID=A0A1S3P0B6_SALSA|nr:rho GTPase-activating protein 15 isoform X1 [Salmo salar]|eukprot:XP_014020985.1 PREDICTED: rho GTPase-activating protein 15 isoform X1 [Salmo salar]